MYLLPIITSTDDELFGTTNSDDLERPFSFGAYFQCELQATVFVNKQVS